MLALSACTTIHAPESFPSRPQRQAIAGFYVEARISVRRDDKPYHASLSWRHVAQRDEILLTGPFGQGIAELVREPAGTRLTTSDRRVFSAPDWSGLTEKVFGVALPLDGMSRWMTGVVTGAELDAMNRPIRAQEDGWNISYSAYESAAPNALPSVLELQRDDIEVRMKIDRWELN